MLMIGFGIVTITQKKRKQYLATLPNVFFSFPEIEMNLLGDFYIFLNIYKSSI